jgi:hypothetical protein
LCTTGIPESSMNDVPARAPLPVGAQAEGTA